MHLARGHAALAAGRAHGKTARRRAHGQPGSVMLLDHACGFTRKRPRVCASTARAMAHTSLAARAPPTPPPSARVQRACALCSPLRVRARVPAFISGSSLPLCMRGCVCGGGIASPRSSLSTGGDGGAAVFSTHEQAGVGKGEALLRIRPRQSRLARDDTKVARCHPQTGPGGPSSTRPGLDWPSCHTRPAATPGYPHREPTCRRQR